jgi:hypothetical protein
MYLASRIVWLCLYESLLTYVAHMDLIGDPLQGTCHARASEILITKMCKRTPTGPAVGPPSPIACYYLFFGQ